jgi:radical SAM superfamily enzyme YgiQ (UPF0313 family)
MARILLANAYLYRLDPKQWRDARPYPPLGTLIAAAVLREAGHAVQVRDMSLAASAQELEPALAHVRPDAVVIHDDGFNYLTKMCLTVMRAEALRMIAAAKALGCRVAVNSSDASDHPELYLAAGADAVVLGESEATLVELMACWQADAPWTGIAGIAFLRDEAVARTAPRPVMRDLDALPRAAWELIDLEPYKRIWRQRHGYWSVNMATTRGCPFKCNWCAKPIYGNRYNSRSPEHVADELQWLDEHHAPDHVWFADDIFGLKPGWVPRFRDALRERGLRIRFKIQSRADLLVEEGAVDALVQAGLEEAWMGAESGSQRILDAMDKGITVEQIAEATRRLKAKGARACFFLQFGYLGEEASDVRRTIRMVEDLLPDDIGVSVSYPLPGTRFHELVKADLKAKSNWSDSDDLAMLYRGAYSPAYYKRLHRYVHKRYRLQQGLHDLLCARPSQRALSTLYYAPAALVEGIRLRALA